ncbi:PcfJ domain-containing protein [Salipaludibacillus sp. HK11]|uniref:PcfJ domain-containing protein n=1 Tax=Salipaludibacillus sp. HK11 TaxID=3394320 RepID=UPI0039FC5C1D
MASQQIKEILNHFPADFSTEFMNYVTDVALLRSRYIFTERSKSRQQYGYCTHCEKTMRTDNFKHNEIVICEECGSECSVKASGRGRKNLFDTAYIVWYEKSIENPKAIIARGIFVVRDYSGDYKEVKTKRQTSVKYLFEPGNSVMIKYESWVGEWHKRATVFSESSGAMQHHPCFYSTENIKKAVSDTQFQYSTWEEYETNELLVKFFDIAAKYPCVEYLTKIGWKNLVYDKLYGNKTFGAINWRGKTLEKVLRVTKSELKTIVKSGVYIEAFTLRIYQLSKKDGSKLTIEEACDFTRRIDSYTSETVKKISKSTTIRKIYNYVIKQYERKNYKSMRYHNEESVILTWKDYLDDCKKLNMDTSQDMILFPTNLDKAHQSTIKKIKHKEDKELNEKFTKRLKELSKLIFECDGLVIRPAESCRELIREGNLLEHCIGGYAEKHAKGVTSIFLLRKAEEPDKPFYTVEVRGNRVGQVSGYKNQMATKKINSFLDEFANTKLKKASETNKKVAQTA